MPRESMSINDHITDNLRALRQGLDLLHRMDDRLYAAIQRPYFQYGVGSHFRHCLDAYQCFLRGVAAGRIDYDERERDERIEQQRARAMARLEATIEKLANLPLADGATPLLVKLEAADPQDERAWNQSSLGRELHFLLSHTIHHYALIALMLRLQGFHPAEDFGIAPSTLAHWRREAACAR
jgi:uncharacterized damage-inducible protein DinB